MTCSNLSVGLVAIVSAYYNKNFLKPCACGCNELILHVSKLGQIRTHKLGHSTKGKKVYRKPKEEIIAGGYIEVYSPNHPHVNSRGRVMKHRLVMEQYLGRYLKPIEEVHHKNKDTLDNRIENLDLCENKAAHGRIHANEDRQNKTGFFSFDRRLAGLMSAEARLGKPFLHRYNENKRLDEFSFT
jgi:hypothetical protein